MNAKTLIVAAVAIATMTMSAISSANTYDGWDNLSRPGYSVTVENITGYTIERIFMGVDDNGNRNDVLGDSVLSSGYQTTIRARSGTYDIEMVDQDGDYCVVNAVSIVANRDLVLTKDMLLRCERYR